MIKRCPALHADFGCTATPSSFMTSEDPRQTEVNIFSLVLFPDMIGISHF